MCITPLAMVAVWPVRAVRRSADTALAAMDSTSRRSTVDFDFAICERFGGKSENAKEESKKRMERALNT